MPLGLGATVEGQVTGEETWGGVQLQAFPLSEPALGAWRAEEARKRAGRGGRCRRRRPAPAAQRMGASSGGYGAASRCRPRRVRRRRLRRRVRWVSARRHDAPAGLPGRPAAVRLGRNGRGRVFVHLVTPPDWRRITGEEPPPSPVDRAAYTRAGLPWFDYYDESAEDLAPTDALGAVKPVGDWLGDDHEPWQAPGAHQVKPLGDAGKPVEDGDW